MTITHIFSSNNHYAIGHLKVRRHFTTIHFNRYKYSIYIQNLQKSKCIHPTTIYVTLRNKLNNHHNPIIKSATIQQFLNLITTT